LAHGKSPHHAPRKRRAKKKAASPESHRPAEAGKPVRLQKLLAAAGFGSRRGAEELLRQGRVTVNGQLAGVGDSADPVHDRVALDGERLVAEAQSYWIAHKPVGMVTTLSDPHGRAKASDLLPEGLPRLFPVGRLDVDTSGLVLFTNDGELTNRLLHPSRGSEREYRVTVKGELDEKSQRRLSKGIHLDDGPSAPATIEAVKYNRDTGCSTLRLTLTEGRKRQIRRSFLALGHPVKRLVRVRIGPLRLGRLARGAARPLRDDEIAALLKHSASLGSRSRASR
jgi:23S rRNA pseudouridine2605 synthase